MKDESRGGTSTSKTKSVIGRRKNRKVEGLYKCRG
jgi:hypothetical protein